MGDAMRLLPFSELISRMLEEFDQNGSIFDIPQESWYRKGDDRKIAVFGDTCETPLGPAAGPHTQLAQNIISAYLTGSRFIELKTVQILDALEIEKPCIDATDEGYNTEWSTELTLDEAWQEYAKAWVALHLVEDLFDTRRSEGERSFAFNMSVGYDLKGITSDPMRRYIARMKDSGEEDAFLLWTAEADAVRRARGIAPRTVSGQICRSVTLSTMHGCPPDEIEAICRHMLTEEHLDTYVKLNPTLLGLERVQGTLRSLGYSYVELNPASFEHDLQYDQALEILHRLVDLAGARGRQFGVKLTNTLPTLNTGEELPGEEMYLSGRALFPLTVSVAAVLSDEFGGHLPISYSGGVTAHNVVDLFRTGIRPITVATDFLKPGGYLRQVQMAQLLEEERGWDATSIDVTSLQRLAERSLSDPTVTKQFRGFDEVKTDGPLPLFDCYVAPCVTACPINQHVPEYIRLVGEKRYADALELIYERNALPAITGAICDHQCQLACTRLDYEGCIGIREIKKIAVEHGMEEYRRRIGMPQTGALTTRNGAGPSEAWPRTQRGDGRHVAIVGAGPAGLSAAYFLRREGFEVTVFEREADAGGVVRYIVPEFRISREEIESDIAMIRDAGVRFEFGFDREIDIDAFKRDGYEYVLLALGTYQTRPLKLEGGNPNTFAAYPFLAQFNRDRESLHLGKRVAVVGAGDTAMDCARAALRTPGVEHVEVVYRRSEAQMPATREEYEYALADEIPFRWLRNPEHYDKDGTLTLRVMELGEPDESGRRRPIPTDRTETIQVDTLIHAVGDDPDRALLESIGFEIDARGLVPTGPDGATAINGVYLIGDGRTGPSTIVKCIAEGRRAADAVCLGVDPGWKRREHQPSFDTCARTTEITAKRGTIIDRPNPHATYLPEQFAATELDRCLECNFVCNKCVDVCPNRANIAIPTPNGGGRHPYQIVHIDAYCNECGNCGHFCPWEGRPYTDKPTIFSTHEDFEASANPGWLLSGNVVRVRFGGIEGELPLVDGALAPRGATTDSGDTATGPGGAAIPPNDPGAHGDEKRFFDLFNHLYATRPHLFGAVEPTRRKPQGVSV